MANFKVGDEVVCLSGIASKGGPLRSDLRAGLKYRVIHLGDQCVCVAEMPLPHTDFDTCHLCGKRTGYWHYYQWRFVKCDGLNEPEAEVESNTLPALVEAE